MEVPPTLTDTILLVLATFSAAPIQYVHPCNEMLNTYVALHFDEALRKLAQLTVTYTANNINSMMILPNGIEHGLNVNIYFSNKGVESHCVTQIDLGKRNGTRKGTYNINDFTVIIHRNFINDIDEPYSRTQIIANSRLAESTVTKYGDRCNTVIHILFDENGPIVARMVTDTEIFLVSIQEAVDQMIAYEIPWEYWRELITELADPSD